MGKPMARTKSEATPHTTKKSSPGKDPTITVVTRAVMSPAAIAMAVGGDDADALVAAPGEGVHDRTTGEPSDDEAEER